MFEIALLSFCTCVVIYGTFRWIVRIRSTMANACVSTLHALFMIGIGYCSLPPLEDWKHFVGNETPKSIVAAFLKKTRSLSR